MYEFYKNRCSKKETTMHSISVKRITAASVVLIVTLLAALAVLFFPFRSSAGQAPEEILDLGVQAITADSIESDDTDLRFLFTVGSLKYSRAGFVFSKTNPNPTVDGDGCTVYETTVVYSAVWENGVLKNAPTGRYWVAVKLTGIENADFDTPIYLNAFVEDKNGIRYAAAEKTTVCKTFGNGQIANDFVPILRFVVASDVHYGESANAQDQKLRDLMDGAYDYSDNHARYKALDGVFFVGDVADKGQESELNRFFHDFYEYTRPGTEAQAVLGNHEFKAGAVNAVSRYLAASGYAAADRHITISGYHFILMSPSEYAGFNDAKIAWLTEQLEIAAADDETGKKPIFVFQHHPPYDTVYGSEDEWGVHNLEPVFEQYPQVVDFAGHSHFPINDPRSIWQGSFTGLNTGSCREWGMDIAGVTSKTTFAIGEEGGWSFSEISGELFDPGKYYVVEVNAASRILIRAFDVGTGVEVMEPIFLASVGDPDRFTYTDDRANHEETPRFAENAEVRIVNTENSTVIYFPRTASGAYVQHYRCEVRQGETLISTTYRLDCGFLFPAPETLTLTLTGLSSDTEYTVSIIPVTSWANDGEPLVFNFRTDEVNPLIFSVQFLDDGSATNSVTNVKLTTCGNPTTFYDETLKTYCAVFDGDDSYELHRISSFYSDLSDSFTFETYLKMDAKPESGYVAPFANEESGGYGFEYNASGSLDFWAHIAGDYRNVGTTLATNEWVHLVATFDGNTLILYKNGEAVATKNVSGTVRTPGVSYLSIGADSGRAGSENFATCTIAVANVYLVAKSADEVADMYAALTD